MELENAKTANKLSSNVAALCLYDPTRCTIFHASFTCLIISVRAIAILPGWFGTRPKTLVRAQHFIRDFTDDYLEDNIIYLINVLYVLQPTRN